MKKTRIVSLLAIIALIGFSGCSTEDTTNEMMGGATETSTEVYTDSELYEYTQVDITEVTKEFSSRDLDNSYDTDYTTIDLSSGEYTITEEGTYYLTGDYNNSQVIVDTVSDEAKVEILFDNITITNDDMAAISIVNADKVFINLIDGSTNTLTVENDFADTEEGIDAVIYSKSDLTIKGTGTLNIESSTNGIVSKDDLVLSSGIYNVTVGKNAIVGKDSLLINSGTYNIDADKDGLKSNNDEEDGFVYIVSGSFNITAGDDGISAVNTVLIDDGDFNIVTLDDGIKSDNDIQINNGTFTIDVVDDAISTYYDLVFYNGTVDIITCYEGLEGKTVIIYDGEYNIRATDDGINAADSDDSLVEDSNDPDGNYHSTSADIIIGIFGGDIFVDVDADGLDSNGNIYIAGGYIEISGAETDMENPMDYNINATIVGGEVVSVGYSGMAQNFSEASLVSVLYNFDVTDSGNVVTITDADGNTVYTYTLLKSASSILISTDKLDLDSSYTISVGGNSLEFTATSNITTIGTVSSNQSGPGGRPSVK